LIMGALKQISEYRCGRCGFRMPKGWGGYMYVVNRAGKRISCPHPTEMVRVYKVLGPRATPETIRRRTGFNSYCVCLDCLKQFKADLGEEGFPIGKHERRDERKCPKCGSANVRTEQELVGGICPRCKEGRFEEIDSGMRA